MDKALKLKTESALDAASSIVLAVPEPFAAAVEARMAGGMPFADAAAAEFVHLVGALRKAAAPIDEPEAEKVEPRAKGAPKPSAQPARKARPGGHKSAS